MIIDLVLGTSSHMWMNPRLRMHPHGTKMDIKFVCGSVPPWSILVEFEELLRFRSYLILPLGRHYNLLAAFMLAKALDRFGPIHVASESTGRYRCLETNFGNYRAEF